MHWKLLALGAILAARPVSAETLAEAVASAYATNPQVAAARAQLRQIDEQVPLAKVGERPSFNISGSATQYLDGSLSNNGRLWTGSVGFSQPIYQGGRVRAGVSAAEARIAASRARLIAVEQQVIVDTIAAYADVLRTEAVVDLNRNQVRVLERELNASRNRFEVGDVTRTDVAQSEARLASARANLISAQAQAVVAQQAYRRLVGRMPTDLAPLPPLPDLPPNLSDALHVAQARNPSLMAARFDEQASAEDVLIAKRQRLPTVGLGVNATYSKRDAGLISLDGFNPNIGVSASMPLTSGGQIAARVRQAQARQSELLEAISLADRQMTEQASNSMVLLESAEAVIQSARTQVSANELASEGVRQENLVGSRDILDVLNAEQELLNSRVQLVQAERDRYVAAFRLLQSIGSADIALEHAPVERYDSQANSRRVAGKWSEFGYDGNPRLERQRNYATQTDAVPPADVAETVPN